MLTFRDGAYQAVYFTRSIKQAFIQISRVSHVEA